MKAQQPKGCEHFIKTGNAAIRFFFAPSHTKNIGGKLHPADIFCGAF